MGVIDVDVKGTGMAMFPIREGRDLSTHVCGRGCTRWESGALPTLYDAMGAEADLHDMLGGGRGGSGPDCFAVAQKEGGVDNIMFWVFPPITLDDNCAFFIASVKRGSFLIALQDFPSCVLTAREYPCT